MKPEDLREEDLQDEDDHSKAETGNAANLEDLGI